jgi:hypothetical protein
MLNFAICSGHMGYVVEVFWNFSKLIVFQKEKSINLHPQFFHHWFHDEGM